MTQEWIVPLRISVSLGNLVLGVFVPSRQDPNPSPLMLDDAGATDESAKAADFPYLDKFNVHSLLKTGFDWATSLSGSVNRHSWVGFPPPPPSFFL